MFTVGRQLDNAAHPFNENDTPEVVLVTPNIDEAYLELRRQYRMLKGTHLVHIRDADGEYTSLALEDYKASIEVGGLEQAIEIAQETHKDFLVQRKFPGYFYFIRLTEDGPEMLGSYRAESKLAEKNPRKLLLVLEENRARIPDPGDVQDWMPKGRIANALLNGDQEVLARFDHHPDAGTDFCVEVEEIESYVADARLGVSMPGEPPRVIDVALGERIRNARTFIPFDAISRKAMATLLMIENDILASLLNRYEQA
jgi:hypothetical protein